MILYQLLIKQKIIEDKIKSSKAIIDNSSVNALNLAFDSFNISPVRDIEELEELKYLNNQYQTQYLN